MTFSHHREEEFLAKVQEARRKLRDFRLAMVGVRLTTSKEEKLDDFVEEFNEDLYALERNCIRNLRG